MRGADDVRGKGLSEDDLAGLPGAGVMSWLELPVVLQESRLPRLGISLLAVLVPLAPTLAVVYPSPFAWAYTLAAAPLWPMVYLLLPLRRGSLRIGREGFWVDQSRFRATQPLFVPWEAVESVSRVLTFKDEHRPGNSYRDETVVSILPGHTGLPHRLVLKRRFLGTFEAASSTGLLLDQVRHALGHLPGQLPRGTYFGPGMRQVVSVGRGRSGRPG